MATENSDSVLTDDIEQEHYDNLATDDTGDIETEYYNSVDKFCRTLLVGTMESCPAGGTNPLSSCNKHVNTFRKTLISASPDKKLYLEGINDICEKLFRDIGVSGWVKDFNNDYVYFSNGNRVEVVSSNEVDDSEKMNSEDQMLAIVLPWSPR